jgi:two-component system OmpR family sensor kinase
VAWWVIRLGVRPIKEMTVTAGRIAEGDREVRVPETDDRTESGALAVALNRMVTSMTESIDARTRSEEKVRQFVADASHELRTPVTTIRGYAELYRHGGLAEPAALDDAMRRTEQEAARMGRLVEDMLTLARLDEQRPLDRRPVDLSRVADDAAADARASSPGRPVVFETDGPAVVVGDEDRLRQVVANVIGNALVHTSPEVPVTLRTGRTADEVWLDVTDEGAGMAPEVAARITERFFRADPARARHRGGSGLGLSIVESAVAAHGGHVVVTSALGAGTTVRLSFPTGSLG